jgi:ABC-2 type transport system permease protein
METLLATPAQPFEVMLGKIVPYILVGYIQVVLILLAAWLLFAVPIVGSLWLLLAALVVFIAANLCIGFTISTVAQSQLQAMQMSFFFFLPSLLLSGFMFPFRGMPDWAQTLGEVFPLTHFLRIVRGILLKGNELPAISSELVALTAILAVASFIAMRRYRQTLD